MITSKQYFVQQKIQQCFLLQFPYDTSFPYSIDFEDPNARLFPATNFIDTNFNIGPSSSEIIKTFTFFF